MSEPQSLDDLTLDPENPRAHPEKNLELIGASLDEVGPVRSIAIDEQGVVHAGNGVTIKARERKLKLKVVDADPDELVAVRRSGLTSEQWRKYAYLDNRTGELASWDATQIAADLQAGMDLSSMFPPDELNAIIEQAASANPIIDGEIPEPQEDKGAELQVKWQTELGQLWELGTHRLLCGDCTDRPSVERLMNGSKAILFATDPPYLVDYDGTNHPHAFTKPDGNKDWSGSYGNVNWDEGDVNCELYDHFIDVAVAVAILPNAAWYCWHASRRQAVIESIWQKYGAFVHQQIIWVKDRPVLTRSWYMWQHEPCFFGWIKGNKPPRTSEDYPRSIWTIDTVAPGTKTLHPTSKPIEVFTIPMLQHTMRGDICYEPFCGSGSQVVAGEKLGRRVFACEIEPRYVAVTLERWHQMTGQEPHLS